VDAAGESVSVEEAKERVQSSTGVVLHGVAETLPQVGEVKGHSEE
jgi:hypothetical protein